MDIFPVGNTTNSFPWTTDEDLAALLRWASDDGFQWVEIHDFDGSMSMDLLSRFNEEASDCNMMYCLACDGMDLIALHDEDVWYRQIAKATVFKSSVYSRITLSTNTVDRSGNGYSRDQFFILKERISRILNFTGEKGLQPVFENSYESIHSADVTFYGFAKMCLDSANFMNMAQLSKPEAAESVFGFIDQYAERIPYVQFKITIGNHLCEDILEKSDFPCRAWSSMLGDGTMVCVGLPRQRDIKATRKHLSHGRQLIEVAERGGTG